MPHFLPFEGHPDAAVPLEASHLHAKEQHLLKTPRTLRGYTELLHRVDGVILTSSGSLPLMERAHTGQRFARAYAKLLGQTVKSDKDFSFHCECLISDLLHGLYQLDPTLEETTVAELARRAASTFKKEINGEL